MIMTSLVFGCGKYQSSETMGDGVVRSVVFAVGDRLHVVIIDFPVHVRELEKEEQKHIRDLQLGEAPYPLDRAARQMLRVGEMKGITHRAQALLSAAADEGSIMTEQELMDHMNDNETPVEGTGTTEGTTTTKESAVTTPKKKAAPKKAPAKPAAAKPVTKAKTPAKKAPAKAKGPAKEKASKGAGGFRAGTAKEKAFVAYKEERKAYDALEHGKKRAWCDKLAAKLGVKAGTISSWIGGEFTRALAK